MNIKSLDHVDYQLLPRAIAAMGKEYVDGHVSRAHSHPRAQFLYAISGAMEVKTPGALWVIPSQRALWIPGNIPHETRMRGHVNLHTLYVDTSCCTPTAPIKPTVIRVSPLLRELIIRAVEMPMEYELGGRDELVVKLILHEIDWKNRSRFSVQLPQDPRLKRIFDSVYLSPADERSLQDWADIVGASSRTLVRLFRSEFGISFRDWRQQMRLLASLSLLAIGTPITRVASDIGYDTPSAFSRMFRRVMGMTPRQYLTEVS